MRQYRNARDVANKEKAPPGAHQRGSLRPLFQGARLVPEGLRGSGKRRRECRGGRIERGAFSDRLGGQSGQLIDGRL